MWVLEFRQTKDGSWTVFTEGTLEECLLDALTLRAGEHVWSSFYDAARLGFERVES